MFLMQRYDKNISRTTRILDDCAQKDWATAQAVKIRAQVVCFFNGNRTPQATLHEFNLFYCRQG